jgi:hypothetical protein
VARQARAVGGGAVRRGGPVGEAGVPARGLAPGEEDAEAGAVAAQLRGAQVVVVEEEVLDRVLLAAPSPLQVRLHPGVGPRLVGRRERQPVGLGEHPH